MKNTVEEGSAVIAVDSDEEIRTVIAIDCMGIVNQLKIEGGTETVSDLADQFVLKVITESSGYGTVILVFDNYGDESEISLLKAQTWLKRYKDTGVEYKLAPRTDITKIKLKDLLSHKSNRKLLCKVLAAASIKQLETNNKQYIVAQTSQRGQRLTVADSQVEADTLIISIVRELADILSDQSPKIKILSPDTDVLILALYLVSIGCSSNIEFELLNSTARRIIPVTPLVPKLGEKKARALLAAYILTGCDQIGKFSTVTKDRAFKVFLALPSDVIDRLAEMGDAFQTDGEIIKAVSRYVMLLYARRQDDRAEIHKMANIGVLRWRLYSKHQKETESLPQHQVLSTVTYKDQSSLQVS